MKINTCTYYTLGYLFLVTLLSCSLPLEETEETPTPEQEVVVDYAPKSIVGKTITVGSQKFYNFSSTGFCSVDYSLIECMYDTPQYTYLRTSNTQARFWAQFIEKVTVYEKISNTTTVYNKTYTVDYTFTFTGESEGTYSGTYTTYTPRTGSGVFVVPAKTRVRSENGNFSLN